MSSVRTIVPLARRTLADRAYFARAWAQGWLVVSPTGRVSVLDAGLAVTHERDGGGALEDVSLGDSLVWASARGLAAVDVASGEVRWRVDGAFMGCRHGAAGLWTAEHRGTHVVVDLRDASSGSVVRSVEIEDRFGESSVMLIAHPDARSVVAWVAAGQDGQATFLVEDDGATLRATEIPPRDRLPPVYVDGGKTYLSCATWLLELRVWPGGEVVDDLEWADEDEQPDDLGGDDVQVVPGGYATWASREGRLHVIDLAAMYVIGELAIAPDFEYATPGPDGLILSVHARQQLVVTRLDDWRPPEAAR